MKIILIDLNKFGNVSVKRGNLNFSINHEKNINNCFKGLEKLRILSAKQHKKLKESEVNQ